MSPNIVLEDPPLLRVASDSLGEVVLALTTTGRRQAIIRARVGDPKKLSPADLVDHLAATHVVSIGGRSYDPAKPSDAEELQKLSVSLSTSQRQEFASAYLRENEHLTSRTDFVHETATDGALVSRIKYEPRDDVSWAADPVERLHQAWITDVYEWDRFVRKSVGPEMIEVGALHKGLVKDSLPGSFSVDQSIVAATRALHLNLGTQSIVEATAKALAEVNTLEEPCPQSNWSTSLAGSRIRTPSSSLNSVRKS